VLFRSLLDPAATWPAASFDVIFCRNVMIYFTAEAIASVLQRFAQALVPDGFLFLGHSESLRGLTRDFALRQSNDTFYYQLGDTAEAEWLPEDFWSSPAPPADAPERAAAAIDDTSWMDAIQRSSDRVASLAVAPRSEPVATRQSPVEPAPPAMHDLDTARRQFREERYADVITTLGGLAASAANADGLLLLAAALLNQNRLAEAEHTCRRLLAQDDANADAACLLAVCREQAGDLPAAQRQAQLAAVLAPRFAMPHLLAGRIARRRGELPLAQRELNQALGLIAREDATRVLLFGGGFGREAMAQMCRAELAACRSRA
jgi:chemotaxis protein methyltransferase CheR